VRDWVAPWCKRREVAARELNLTGRSPALRMQGRRRARSAESFLLQKNGGANGLTQSLLPSSYDDPSTNGVLRAVRRAGRQLLDNDLIFDFGAWAYARMTANAIWLANCARLLDDVPPGIGQFCVLDLGAGPGISTLTMGQRRPSARFIAFDLAQQMLDLAARNRAKAGWSSQRLALLRGDAHCLPLGASVVDVVTGHSFLYLLPNFEAALAEVHRVLRPGGYIAFLEPHAGVLDWHWLWRQRSPGLQISLSLWRVYSWLHRRFTAEWLAAVLAASGFAHVQTEVTLGGFGLFARGRKP
jgi:ubiquinone/menaquinone biosynthesis C-methylase UbiE